MHPLARRERPRDLRRAPGRPLLATALVALAACSGGSTTPAIRQGGTLYVALDGDPASLNPLVANDPVSARAYAPLFPLIYSANPDLSVAPDLASALPTVGGSGTVLTVPLHDDARWSDGVPITAADVVFTVTTEMNPALATHAVFDWSDLKSVSAVNQFTVRFTLVAPDAAFLADSLVTPIVPQHALSRLGPGQIAQAAFSSAPTVTGGPFTFDHRVPGQAIYLKADPDYFLGDPHIDEIVETVVSDPSQLVTRLENGKLTWAPELPAAAAASAVSTPGITVSAYPATALIAVVFNVRAGRLFSDHSLREAFAHGLAHDAITAQATGDAQGYPVWGAVNPNSWAYDQGASPPYPQDTGRARQLLTQDGWTVPASGVATRDGQALAPGLIFPTSDPTLASAASAIAQQGRASGFRISPQGLETSAYASLLRSGGFDAALVSLPTSLDPDPSDFLASGAPLNYGGYTRPALDALLGAEIAATPSATESLQQVRKPILDRIEQLLSTDLPMYFLWVPRVFTGFNAVLGGVAGVGAQLEDDRADTFYRDWYFM